MTNVKMRLGLSVVIIIAVALVLRAYIPRPHAPFINAPDLERRMSAGEVFRIIDTRAPSDYSRGHIPGSTHVPDPTSKEWTASLNADDQIVIICPFGRDAVDLTRKLIDAGFKNAVYLRGGFRLWRGPVSKSP